MPSWSIRLWRTVIPLTLSISWRKALPVVPIVLVSSKGYEREAFAALRKGASSYVPKDLLAEELLPTLHDLFGVFASKALPWAHA